jgi:tetratricopeptide (TPR) repeat protein
VANRRPRGFNILGHADEDRLEVIGTALDLVGQAPSAERAELLSLQAIELVFTGDHQGALQASDEADVIAARLDDATVRARLGVRRMFACQIPERAVALAKESADLVGLADSTGDPQLRILSRRPTPLLYVGALTEAHRRMAEAMAIADESGRLVLRSRAHFEYAATLDALGDHEEAKRLTEVAFELGQQASWPDARQFYGGRMGLHWSFEGELETLIAAAAQGVVQSPKPVVWQGMWALGLALCGREEELTRLLTEVSDALPRVPVDHFWLVAHWLFATAQGFGTEDRQLAATLYDLLLPYRALHAHYGTGYWGPVEVALAVAARVKGDTETAMNHHEAAAATIEACGAARARALNGYQWARTILARGNDLQRASVLAEETLAYCESKGYTTFVPRTEELLTTISTA